MIKISKTRRFNVIQTGFYIGGLKGQKVPLPPQFRITVKPPINKHHQGPKKCRLKRGIRLWGRGGGCLLYVAGTTAKCLYRGVRLWEVSVSRSSTVQE